MRYRADIDGLRAVAVAPVVLFHVAPGLLPGGFIGVDVFFIISGFLITHILCDRATVEGKSFNSAWKYIADFYARRVRRIFPGLLACLASVLVLGWILLLPEDFKVLGKNATFSALFSANLNLMRGAGYFEGPEERNALLHMWSLGVEEQFYFVWPVVVFFLCDKPRSMLFVLASLIAASFVYCLWSVERSPTVAFYSPISRFWELGAGAAAAILRREWPSVFTLGMRWPSILGVVLVGIGLLIIRQSSAFPGWLTLLPVFGALLVVLFSPSPKGFSVLSLKPVVYIGLISFPLYLWHWPVTVFTRLYFGDVSPVAAVVVVAVSVVLAVVTYEFLEKPVRGVPKPLLEVSLLGVTICLAAVGFASARGVFLPASSLFNSDVVMVAKAQADWPREEVVDRSIGHQRSTLFLGDSYMQQYLPRIEELGAKSQRGYILHTKGGCAPFVDIERVGKDCHGFANEGFQLARRSDVDRVVIAASWVNYVDRGDYYRVDDPDRKLIDPKTQGSSFARLEREVSDLVRSGKSVTLVLTHPSAKQADPGQWLARDGLGWKRVEQSAIRRSAYADLAAPMHQRLRSLAKAAGASVIDPSGQLCDQEFCAIAQRDGTPRYKDATHLRAEFVVSSVTYLDGAMLQ